MFRKFFQKIVIALALPSIPFLISSYYTPQRISAQVAVSPGGNTGVTLGTTASYSSRNPVSVSSRTTESSPALSTYPWTYNGAFAAFRNASSTNPWIFPTTTTIAANRFALCAFAVDNDGDGNHTNDMTTLTDTAGNTWTSGGEAEVDPAAGAAGVSIAWFYSTLSSQLVAGSSFTLTFGSAKIAKTSACFDFITSTSATKTLIAGSEQRQAVVAGGVGQLQITGMTAGTSKLIVRLVGTEARTNRITSPSTGGWAVLLSTGYDSGSDTSSMFQSSEFLVSTQTVATSSPTMQAGTFDNVSDMIGFEQQ